MIILTSALSGKPFSFMLANKDIITEAISNDEHPLLAERIREELTEIEEAAEIGFTEFALSKDDILVITPTGNNVWSDQNVDYMSHSLSKLLGCRVIVLNQRAHLIKLGLESSE